MTNKAEIEIDLDKLADIAHVGVRRAALFLGLALNAINQPGFRDYQLRKLPIQESTRSLPVDLFPADLPDEQVEKFKTEFRIWIAGGGLREMLEYYALFLDNMHNLGLLVQKSTGKLGQRDSEKEQRSFSRNGSITEKMRLLKERFGVCPNEVASITQLYIARNCLTHDLGIITANRCDQHGVFSMSWIAFDTLAIGDNSGAEQPLAKLLVSGEATKEQTTVAMRRVTRSRVFKVGETLALSQQDLWEQCLFFRLFAIPSAIQSFTDFLKASGIAMRVREAKPPK